MFRMHAPAMTRYFYKNFITVYCTILHYIDLHFCLLRSAFSFDISESFTYTSSTPPPLPPFKFLLYLPSKCSCPFLYIVKFGIAISLLIILSFSQVSETPVM